VGELAIGIDFGGTKMLGVVVDPEGNVLAAEKVPTPYAAEDLLVAMTDLVRGLEKHAGERVTGVGVGPAGLVDRAGVLRFGPNVGHVKDFDVFSGMQERLPGYRISVENDATCAAWAECLLGAGQQTPDMMLVTLGTGIGGGVILDGRPYRGIYGFAGEPGHMTVAADGVRCICGKDGCWEAYVSGRALGRMGRERVQAGGGHDILRLAGAVEDVRSEHVAQAARAGDETAREIMSEFARWLAIGVSNLVAIMDPRLVVIGGGLAEVADLYLEEAQQHYRQVVFGSAHRPDVPMVVATMGERAGAVGAAMLIHRESIDRH
jgi:glucokinase